MNGRKPRPRPAPQLAPLQPEEILALKNFGHNLLQDERYKEAKAVFCVLHEDQPDDPWIALGLALTFDHLGVDQEAGRVFSLACTLAPTSPTTWMHQGAFHLHRGRRTKAIACFQRARSAAERQGSIRSVIRANTLLGLIGHAGIES